MEKKWLEHIGDMSTVVEVVDIGLFAQGESGPGGERQGSGVENVSNGGRWRRTRRAEEQAALAPTSPNARAPASQTLCRRKISTHTATTVHYSSCLSDHLLQTNHWMVANMYASSR